MRKKNIVNSLREPQTEWSAFRSSRRGNRATNDDFVELGSHTHECGAQTWFLIACDGVGSEPGSAACAHKIGRAVKRVLSRYVLAQEQGGFGEHVETELDGLLRTLPVRSVKGAAGAATMVAALYWRDTRRTPHLVVAWAGDSQAHLMDETGVMTPLTADHTDEEGHLTAYYTANGRVQGFLEVRRILLTAPPLAMDVTTDGVHGKCSLDEWRLFMAYCLIDSPRANRRFGAWLRRFLGENVSDNYSACILLSQDQVPIQKLEDLLQSAQKNR